MKKKNYIYKNQDGEYFKSVEHNGQIVLSNPSYPFFFLFEVQEPLVEIGKAEEFEHLVKKKDYQFHLDIKCDCSNIYSMKQTLGQFIQKVRADKKITQEELAQKSRLARSYISRLEDDQFKSPSAMVLIRLAKGLGVSHDTIFQIAGYIPKIAKTDLPAFDVYLRTKFPKISEQGIKDIEFYINATEKRYKNNQ